MKKEILVETSARHLHVSQQDLETLFGEGGFPVCPVYYYTNMYCANGITNMGYTPMGYFFMQYAQPAE